MFRFFLLFLLLHVTTSLPKSVDNMKPTAEDLFFDLNTPRDHYTVPDLPFKYNAMEPFIDTATMEIHHSVIFKVMIYKKCL